jgi:hypothetical protein
VIADGGAASSGRSATMLFVADDVGTARLALALQRVRADPRLPPPGRSGHRTGARALRDVWRGGGHRRPPHRPRAARHRVGRPGRPRRGRRPRFALRLLRLRGAGLPAPSTRGCWSTRS